MKEFYNIDALMENSDPLTVALHIGMEVVSKGRYNYIQCPGHLDYLGKYDTKISNAILTSNGYHCFACNRSVNLIDMVKEYYKNYLNIELDFASTLSIIAETCGGKELYLLNKNDVVLDDITIQKNTFILNKKELELIGISTASNNIIALNSESVINRNSQKKYKKHYKYNDEKQDFDVEYIEYYNEPTSIYTYYNEDKLSCIEMLLEKTTEKIKEIKSILNLIDEIDISDFFNNRIIKENDISPYMKDILLKQYYSCSNIEKKIKEELQKIIKEEVELGEEEMDKREIKERKVLDSVIYENLYCIENINEDRPF